MSSLASIIWLMCTFTRPVSDVAASRTSCSSLQLSHRLFSHLSVAFAFAFSAFVFSFAVTFAFAFAEGLLLTLSSEITTVKLSLSQEAPYSTVVAEYHDGFVFRERNFIRKIAWHEDSLCILLIFDSFL